MNTLPCRRHVPHWEVPGGTVCITWRLHREQRPLTADERDVVLSVVRRCDPTYGALVAAVVMDDHAHVLVTPAEGITARRLAGSWKGTSSHLICRLGRRCAPIWQREYFDRWMRSSEQTTACAKYIIGNPSRRWPEIECYKWRLPTP